MSVNPNNQLDKQVAWTLIVLIVIFAFAIFFLQAWILMLIVGALYNSMGWFTPIGYGVSCLIVLGLNLVGGFFRTIRS
jgi:hypothetical protein